MNSNSSLHLGQAKAHLIETIHCLKTALDQGTYSSYLTSTIDELSRSEILLNLIITLENSHKEPKNLFPTGSKVYHKSLNITAIVEPNAVSFDDGISIVSEHGIGLFVSPQDLKLV